MENLDRLVWVDVETFGIAPDEPILEVGFIMTDLDLEVVEGPYSVLCWEPKYLKRAASHVEYGTWVGKTHTANNLFDYAQAYGISRERADAELTEALGPYAGLPMVGNSVHADRAWLREQMPQFEAAFHYRNIDISSVKELCKRLNPDLYAKLPKDLKKEEHRVIPDLYDSFNEARFYMDNFLFQCR